MWLAFRILRERETGQIGTEMVATVPTRPWERQDYGQFHILGPISVG